MLIILERVGPKDQLFEDIQTAAIIVTFDIVAKFLHCSLDKPASVQDDIVQLLSRSLCQREPN